jgi:ribosomal 50S subunit-recycling heat shock protein
MSRTYLNGKLLTSLDQLKEGDVIETHLGEGSIHSRVITFQRERIEEKNSLHPLTPNHE